MTGNFDDDEFDGSGGYESPFAAEEPLQVLAAGLSIAVEITYLAEGHVTTRRKVLIDTVESRNGRTPSHFSGECGLRGARRTFRLDGCLQMLCLPWRMVEHDPAAFLLSEISEAQALQP